MSLTDLFTDILAKREADLQKNNGPWPKNQPTASDLSPCTRETVLAVLHWKDRPGFSTELLGRLEAGTDAERRVLPKLVAYGFDIVEQQRMFELKNATGRVILRGKIDGKLMWGARRVPFDLKTVEPLVFPKLNTLDDVLRHPFYSKWARQMYAYLYLNDEEVGFLFLEDLKGHWKFIEVPLDLDAMERIVVQCETAVNAVEAVLAGTPEDDALPPYHTETAVCRRCWAFGRVCQPPWSTGSGLKILEDPELEDQLRRHQELKGAHSQYEALDKTIKATVRGQSELLVGSWLVTGKEGHRKGYEVKPATTWTTTIQALAGPAPAVEEET